MKYFKIFLLFGLMSCLGCAGLQLKPEVAAETEQAAKVELRQLQKTSQSDQLLYIQSLKDFIQKYDGTVSSYQARYLMSQSYYKQNLLSESYKILNDMDLSELPLSLQVKSLYLLALDAKQMGLSYDSVRWNIQLLPLLKSNKMSKKVKQEILDVIETELEKDHIEALLTESSEAFPAAKLNFRMGRILYDEADVSSATQYFNRALDLTQDGFEKEKIQEFIIQMNKTYLTQKHVIGCVLPLTGKYEDYGQKSLRAIQYALGFFNKEEKKSKDLLGTPSYELAIYDSQGDIQEATKGVETLLEKHGVIAIIGPLLSSTSEQAALRAQQLQVPLINLSQHPTLNEIGDFVFRISMTKDQQTDALVKYACEQKQLKKYAILYPEDSYGIEFANQFWTKIEACGGQVVGIEAYKPRQSSFNNEIKKLVGLFYPRARKYEYRLIEEQLKMEQNREEIQEKEIKLSPIIDFEAVFIPDYARTIGQVAPSLAYYDIENVTLLGTQGWNSKDLIKRGTEYVKDAVFVDGFFADSLQAQSQAFVKGFERIFGEEPQIWEAQAFDAAELLLTFLEKEEMQSRIQLKTELLALSEVTGVTGRMDFSDHNQIKKDLFLLTVKNNAIVALEELGPVPEM